MTPTGRMRSWPACRKSTRKEVVPALMKQFGYKSRCRCRASTKITLNMGVGEAVGDKKILDNAVGDMHEDRRPEAGRHQGDARRSPASRSARAIRSAAWSRCASARMYEFLDRLVTIALPRVRDFRGISGRAFDGRGNYNIGVKEQIIFPEIEYDKIDALRGMNITITTTAKTDDEAKALLAAFQFPVQELRAHHGQTVPDQPRREAHASWSRSSPRSAPSCRRSSTTRRRPTRTATRRASSCSSCRATPTRRACATAAR